MGVRIIRGSELIEEIRYIQISKYTDCMVNFTVYYTYLLRLTLSSSCSKWNIGRHCLHLARSLAVSLASLQTAPVVFQHILPCPHWSSNPPPAAFQDPFQSRTSWSGCRECDQQIIFFWSFLCRAVPLVQTLPSHRHL